MYTGAKVRVVPCEKCEHWRGCAWRSSLYEYVTKFEESKQITFDSVNFRCEGFKKKDNR